MSLPVVCSALDESRAEHTTRRHSMCADALHFCWNTAHCVISCVLGQLTSVILKAASCCCKSEATMMMMITNK